MARYGVGLAVHSMTFPYATLIVTVIGCFCIGLTLPSLERAAALSPEVRLFVIVGFLGGFTTFSAFGNESIALVRSGILIALVNVAGNVFLGLAAVVIGRAVAALDSRGCLCSRRRVSPFANWWKMTRRSSIRKIGNRRVRNVEDARRYSQNGLWPATRPTASACGSWNSSPRQSRSGCADC
jgi:CrcB protein